MQGCDNVSFIESHGCIRYLSDLTSSNNDPSLFMQF